ncbi:hypothetical protein P3T21_006867 [Paraburkholderia sp. GAS334]
MRKKFTADDGVTTADMVHCGLDHLTAAQLLFASDAHTLTRRGIYRIWAWNCC